MNHTATHAIQQESTRQPHIPARPQALRVQEESLPPDLEREPAWVVWRYEPSNTKWTKPPFQARAPRVRASTTDRQTWGSMRAAIDAYRQPGNQLDGIGRVVTGDIVGIDLDHVVGEDGQVEDWAQQILDRFTGHYMERSPSGDGIRMFCRGNVHRCGKGGPGNRLEVYSKDSPRYLTVTGHRLQNSAQNVGNAQEALDWLHESFMQRPQTVKKQVLSAQPLLSDDEVLQRCQNAKNSAKFQALWDGDAGEDHSSADMSLVSSMAFYTQDTDQLDRLFRRSALMREKWDKRHSADDRTYGEMTIAKALERDELYSSAPPNLARSFDVPRAGAIERNKRDWPVLDSAALYGLAGEIVLAIEPNTESDRVAILIQLLVGWGIYVGRGPYYQVEGDKHYSNLCTILVGSTSKGRKGTSWGRIHEIFKAFGDGFCPVVSGLSSGEGLKYHVRDPVADADGKVTDSGVNDKRVLVQESEFAQVLKTIERPGNTLSATVRSAWDTGELRTLTKNDATIATGAHIGIIGHITEIELKTELAQSDAANGFANRFVFVCVRRSKELPFGGDLFPEAELRNFADQLEHAAHTARQKKRIQMTDAAREHWVKIYPALSAGHAGLFGAVTGRAEAQVVRLAMIYALLDSADAIDLAHLLAAEALWRYCESSARYIFGTALGDSVADEILSALRTASEGLSRTQIRDLFQRNRPAERIGMALDLLREHGLAKCERRETSGRPSEIWLAC